MIVNPQNNIQNPPLCFGGSFNPIHFGHLRCAAAAAQAKHFSAVMFIPTAQPPHKTVSGDLATPSDRLTMTHLAAEAFYSDHATDSSTEFVVSDLELRRDGPSYTFDTVCQLKALGWRTVTWLIGADMLNYLPRWHRADELLQEVEFLILERPGVPIDWTALPSNYQKLRQSVVTAPLVDLSATEIRNRVRQGLPINGMTPPPVIEYIREHGLYRG